MHEGSVLHEQPLIKEELNWRQKKVKTQKSSVMCGATEKGVFPALVKITNFQFQSNESEHEPEHNLFFRPKRGSWWKTLRSVWCQDIEDLKKCPLLIRLDLMLRHVTKCHKWTTLSSSLNVYCLKYFPPSCFPQQKCLICCIKTCNICIKFSGGLFASSFAITRFKAERSRRSRKWERNIAKLWL